MSRKLSLLILVTVRHGHLGSSFLLLSALYHMKSSNESSRRRWVALGTTWQQNNKWSHRKWQYIHAGPSKLSAAECDRKGDTGCKINYIIRTSNMCALRQRQPSRRSAQTHRHRRRLTLSQLIGSVCIDSSPGTSSGMSTSDWLVAIGSAEGTSLSISAEGASLNISASVAIGDAISWMKTRMSIAPDTEEAADSNKNNSKNETDNKNNNTLPITIVI